MTDLVATGISPLAIELAEEYGLFDLHIDTLIPPRLWGYDVLQRHGTGVLGGRFFGHLDLPRIAACRMSGAMWSLTTNPFRTEQGRWRAWQANLARFDALVAAAQGQLKPVKTAKELQLLRGQPGHAVALAVQGANAWQAAQARDPGLDTVLADGRIVRATLVHLTDSSLGATSSPLSVRANKELTPLGAQLVAALNRHRVFVDLAHAHPTTFWQAVQVHDRDLPLIATHTGVCGIKPHWRNVDDRQVRAIAESGGVVGIIAALPFLTRARGPRDAMAMVEHLEHAIAVGGEACAAIGSDLDGAIVPPHDLRDGLGHLRLIDAMVRRGWARDRIGRVCAGNFVATWQRLRPDSWVPLLAQQPPTAA